MHARPEEFPEDHNSADTLSLFQPAALEDSLDVPYGLTAPPP